MEPSLAELEARLEAVGNDREVRGRTDKLITALAAGQRTSDAAIARIAAVAESFGRFTQLDLAQKRVFNVVDSLNATVALLRPNVPNRIQLESHFEAVPDIEGWPGQLNQAFMTVLLNATQAIDGEGVVTVETSTASGSVVVRVRDTGRGMGEEERAHLFDVGWAVDGKRTKMRLGLPAAHATIERHGGEVQVQSAPGEGTCFMFSFPTHADGSAAQS